MCDDRSNPDDRLILHVFHDRARCALLTAVNPHILIARKTAIILIVPTGKPDKRGRLLSQVGKGRETPIRTFIDGNQRPIDTQFVLIDMYLRLNLAYI